MDLTSIEEKMEKTLSVLQENLGEIRAGRANPAILNKIKVDYYGVATPINQVAGISVPEARLIVIQPWDMSLLKEIEKEILKSDIVKDIKKIAEESKVSIRSIRREGMDEAKELQKSNQMTEDEEKSAEAQIQKLTDSKIEEIDKMIDAKEKEIMSV